MNVMLYLSYINCGIILFSVISIFFIPDKKYFEEKHFTEILKSNLLILMI